MNEIKLKPCPFCGQQNNPDNQPIITTWYGTEYSIECTLCDATQEYFGTKEGAIANWNRRIE